MAKTTKIKKPKLSSKPSEMIIQALDDLIAVEKLKSYKVDMDEWHTKETVWDATRDEYVPVVKAKCSVCFAGSVIARAGNDPKLEIEPQSFDDSTRDKLFALNSFREGDILYGLDHLGISIPRILPSNVDVVDYSDDPKQFKIEMRQLAGIFAAVGL